MASRISFYCAVFLGMLLYDASEALNCYTQSTCNGAGCTIGVDRGPVVTECSSYSDRDVCVKLSWEETVNRGYKAYYTRSMCSTLGYYGPRKGCSSLDELPYSLSKLYEYHGDSFKYCLCDQDLCNTGSVTATCTLPVMIGSLLFTLLAFFRQA